MMTGETPRAQLISALAVAMTGEQACVVVAALEAYLEEGPLGVSLGFEDLTPNYTNEIERLRGERDAAVEFAEQALQKMQETLKTLKVSR